MFSLSPCGFTLGCRAPYDSMSRKNVENMYKPSTNHPQTIHKPLNKFAQTTQTIRFWRSFQHDPPESNGLCGLYNFFQWFVDGLWNGLYGLYRFSTVFVGDPDAQCSCFRGHVTGHTQAMQITFSILKFRETHIVSIQVDSQMRFVSYVH